MQTHLNIVQVKNIAKSRWLKTKELYTIFYDITKNLYAQLIVEQLPNAPKEGDIFILDQSKLNKKWKRSDGYLYAKRSNGRGHREDREVLKLQNQKVIICIYTYVVDQKQMSDSNIQKVILHRRIYKLTKNQDSKYIIVHYRKPTNKTLIKTSPILSDISLSNNSLQTFEQNRNIKIQDFNQMPGQMEEEKEEYTHSNNRNRKGDNFNFMNLDQKILISESPQQANNNPDNLFDFFRETEENLMQNNQFGDQITKTTNDQFDNDNFFKDFFSNTSQQIKQKPKDNTHKLQARIKVLEERIKTLEIKSVSNISTVQEQKNESFSTISDNFSMPNSQDLLRSDSKTNNTFQPDTLINIVDYAPQWDYEQGGAKILICYSPSINITSTISEPLTVHFGHRVVQAVQIQPGVIKCFAPSSRAKKIQLKIMLGQKLITNQLHINQNIFEYKRRILPQHSSNKMEIETQEQQLQKQEECKIRIFSILIKTRNLLLKNTKKAQKKNKNELDPYTESKELTEFFEKTNPINMTGIKVLLILKELLQCLSYYYNAKQIIQLMEQLDQNGNNLCHYCAMISKSFLSF